MKFKRDDYVRDIRRSYSGVILNELSCGEYYIVEPFDLHLKNLYPFGITSRAEDLILIEKENND